MGLITPAEIAAKAERAYPRFLKSWIRGDGASFFPYRVRTRLTLDARDPQGTIIASEALASTSKAQRGWGYTVHRESVRTRDFGQNLVPTAVTIDTLDDLVRLAKRKREFDATCQVADRVRAALPQLNDWLIASVGSLHAIAEPIDGLIDVAKFFLNHPWPDCYARQIPVRVDTKFVDRHQTVLRQWLDILLSSSAIDINESSFARRFGLRDRQPHRALRVLDSQLQSELKLPFDELSLPLRLIAGLVVRDATVVIVENDQNLLTLPSIRRGLGIRGEGNAVNRLERIRWLNSNRLLYWGDIDAEGFVILSRLRNLFPHAESVMMDCRTLEEHQEFIIEGTGASAPMPTNLAPFEAAAHERCAISNSRLEQEKILQPYVEQSFAALTCMSHS